MMGWIFGFARFEDQVQSQEYPKQRPGCFVSNRNGETEKRLFLGREEVLSFSSLKVGSASSVKPLKVMFQPKQTP